MIVPQELIDRVVESVEHYVRDTKGYEQHEWGNPLSPVDVISAFTMAKLLTESGDYNQYVAVAPEGHIYGYFFDRCCSVRVLSVHVGYPPTGCELLDDMGVIQGQSVLLLEDDVASGKTLELVVEALKPFRPASIDLYLGRPKDGQVLDHIDPGIGKVHLAEDHLKPSQRTEHEIEFVEFFWQRLSDTTHR